MANHFKRRNFFIKKDFQGKLISVTVSIGVSAGIPGDAHKALETMIARSDEALYAAKNTGRNCVKLSPDPHQPT